MKLSFRKNHLFLILKAYEEQKLPLDAFLSNYFRSHKSLGAHDRRFLSETLYGMIRFRALLDFLSSKPPSWKKRYEIFSKGSLDALMDSPEIPSHIQVSFPKEYFQKLVNAYGEILAKEIGKICNTQAPITLRVNALKTSREFLFSLWKEHYPISSGEYSPFALHFHKRINFFELEEFKKGFFEIQDEGSQQMALLVDATPGEKVLDFCAGSGGKTLAFAPQMQNKGQIYLHDLRDFSLRQAKKRLRRAGIQNVQFLFSQNLKEKTLKNTMDWVLLDVPCSGSGTLRRNPDMKWNFSFQNFPYLLEEQRKIFDKAFPFLKKSGKIVYITCSLFPEENEQQIEYFLNHYPLKLEKPPLSFLPEKGGRDGFFGAILSQRI